MRALRHIKQVLFNPYICNYRLSSFITTSDDRQHGAINLRFRVSRSFESIGSMCGQNDHHGTTTSKKKQTHSFRPGSGKPLSSWRPPAPSLKRRGTGPSTEKRSWTRSGWRRFALQPSSGATVSTETWRRCSCSSPRLESTRRSSAPSRLSRAIPYRPLSRSKRLTLA